MAREVNHEFNKKIHPLAQTFFVSEPDGVFITKIGLFFSEVSSTLPVTLDVRTAEKGNPSTLEYLPGSVVTKTAAQMSSAASAAGTTETEFVFDEPMFLNGGQQYAFCLRTAAKNKYKVWTSLVGDYKLGTTQERVTRQIEPGAMFKSQAGLSYHAEVNADIKFKIYRASFTASSGTAIFKDDVPPVQTLGTNPFAGAAGDATITMSMNNHGFVVNEKVNIQGLTAGSSYNGILGSSIMGQRTVTGVDGNALTFEADSNCDSAISFGGTGATSTRQYKMDLVQLQAAEFVPTPCETKYSGVFTTTTSLAGTESPGAQPAAIELDNYRDTLFDFPRVILSDSNEANYAGITESTKITATMSGLAGNNALSPVIDMQRAQLIAITNVVDRQASGATTGYNVPLNYVAETDPKNGSSLAKHITKPVKLENGATGLKILFGGHRMEGSHIDVYFRSTLTGTDSDIQQKSFTAVPADNDVPNDVNRSTFHDYRYTVGGTFAKDQREFDQYQIKLVFGAQNSSNVPRIKDLRTIAVA